MLNKASASTQSCKFVLLPILIFSIAVFVTSVVLVFVLEVPIGIPTTTTTTTSTTSTSVSTTSTSVFSCQGLSWNDTIVASEFTNVAEDVNSVIAGDIDAFGQPFIFFLPFSTIGLWVARRNATGTWTDELVDPQELGSTLLTYRSLSAALVDGQPAVTYQTESPSFELWFATYNGVNWVLEDLGAGGFSTSMVVAPDGHPRIAHVHSNNSVILVTRSTGPIWTSEIVALSLGLDTVGSVVALLGGEPVIAYQYITSFPPFASTIVYTRWNGTAWEISTVANEIESDVFIPFRIKENDFGNISIAYSLSAGSTKYGTFDDISWTIESIPSLKSSGHLDLGYICDLPMITHCNATLCGIAMRNVTWIDEHVFLPGRGIEQGASTLFNLNGFPAFAYTTSTDGGRLMFSESF